MKRLLLSAVLSGLLMGTAGLASAHDDDDRWDRKGHDGRDWNHRDHDDDRRHFGKPRHRIHHPYYYHPGRGHYKPWKHHYRNHYYGGRHARHWDPYGRHDDGVTIIFKGRID